MTLSSFRKRKLAEIEIHNFNGFNIQPHISSPFNFAVRITPVVILSQTNVPLNWVAGVPSRVFDTSLDFPDFFFPGDVAISKIEGERQLSAVEKLVDGLYVLYRLSTQVKLKDVRKLASQISRLHRGKECRPLKFTPYNLSSRTWWENIGSGNYPFPKHEATTRDCNVSSSLVKWDILAPDWPLSNYNETEKLMAAPKSKDQVLNLLRHQYYETLYLSKTSLAYFSKSSLSRARAMFQQNSQPPIQLQELGSFLQEMVIPLEIMDIKYRKSLIQLISEESIDDTTVVKLDEQKYVQKWRFSKFGDFFVNERDLLLRDLLLDLRIRETELQVILLLEILSLNKEISPDTLSSSTTSKRKRHTKKNNKDSMLVPDTLLELLVDRLCIWYSIGSDISEPKDQSTRKFTDSTHEKDHLRHFCFEVLMPFYASKLPEKCSSIIKKFGGNVPGSKRIRGSRRKNILGTSKNVPKLNKILADDGKTGLPFIAPEATSTRNGRGGTLNSKNFSKRVIQVDTKLELKKPQEELRDAIKAITKPHRIALATELVNDAEQRQARGTHRKSKKPMRIPTSNILVAATPQKRKRNQLSTDLIGFPNSRLHDISSMWIPFESYAGSEFSDVPKRKQPVLSTNLIQGSPLGCVGCSPTSNNIPTSKMLPTSPTPDSGCYSPVGVRGINVVEATPLKKPTGYNQREAVEDDLYEALGLRFTADL